MHLLEPLYAGVRAPGNDVGGTGSRAVEKTGPLAVTRATRTDSVSRMRRQARWNSPANSWVMGLDGWFWAKVMVAVGPSNLRVRRRKLMAKALPVKGG